MESSWSKIKDELQVFKVMFFSFLTDLMEELGLGDVDDLEGKIT